MAANKTAKSTGTYDPDELVSVRMIKDNGKYKDDVFVAVNGESIQIQRGKTVSIKRKFADVLENSEIQAVTAAQIIEQARTGKTE